MYAGKHARPGGTGNRLTPLSGVSGDDLRAEDALDRSGHESLQRLLGSIHVGGIRLQSPFYLAGARRPRRRPDDTVPLVRV